eukprot:SAG31_NODE_5291_length_2628_cov_1.947805_2_plen_260_part_00
MGASAREAKARGVYGASDDVPSEFSLHPHNEQAYLAADEQPSYPRKVFFCCLEVAPVGGETPLLLNAELKKLIAPSVIERFRRAGVRYRSIFPSGKPFLGRPSERQNLGGAQTWQEALGTTSKVQAERQATARGYTCEWNLHDDSLAMTSAVRPALFPLQPLAYADEQSAVDEAARGDKVQERFWNQATNVFSFVPCWGDSGEPIEEPILEGLNAAVWNAAIAFQWSEGDVLCLDNELAAHGRMSFDGPREVLAAFAKI